ncbi:MAG: GerMN domain-containing protein [Candidatus Staskawiczbacteria bacterium]|nr:GerMN domain-containing protein [Candidatus Staskawiczbacteria bacterium]
MINTKQGVWLLGILGFIMVILIGILIFVPAKPKIEPIKTGIIITSPKSNEEVSLPIKITGYVNGDGWSGFEGQVGTVELLDGNGQLITRGILAATTEWTTLPTNFETTLNFATPKTEGGTLVFKNENASGMPDKDRSFFVAIKFSKNKTIQVGVFFGNQSLSSSSAQDECQRVYRSYRYVKETPAVAQAAINELLKGPTDAEMLAGFFTSIPKGSVGKVIRIVDGQAWVDFNETTESGGGSCSMASRVAQIEETLKQFPTVTSVKLYINGRTGDIFQP